MYLENHQNMEVLVSRIGLEPTTHSLKEKLSVQFPTINYTFKNVLNYVHKIRLILWSLLGVLNTNRAQYEIF